MAERPAAIAFDIIGTLFRLEALRSRLVQAGLPGEVLETWYAETLRDAFALSATGVTSFRPFHALLEATLAALFRRHGIAGSDADRAALVVGWRSLPPYPDLGASLAALAAAGMPVIALSNGSRAATEALFAGAGLRGHVAQILSVEDIGLFKPCRDIYLHAASAAGLPPARLMMVATHAWDLHGAKSAGLATGFIARGQTYPDTMAAPDVIGADLADLIGTVIALPARA